MQEISLEQLKQLLPGKLQESGGEVADGVYFKALCEEYRKIQIWSVSVRHAYDAFVGKILSRYKPIRFVGDGSSRSAFACVGGKCIKVAKCQAGIAQNRQEDKNTAKRWWRRSYDCFAKTYEHSGDFALLLSECCSRIDSEKRLAEALGMDDESTLTAVIWAVADEKSHDVEKSATSLRAKCTAWRKSGGSVNGMPLSGKNIAAAERATEWLESLSDKQSLTPGKKSFLQIANFWKKHGTKELLPGDVGLCRNWGYAIRDGELAPVLLDAGFSQKVADVFYEDDNMTDESKLINYWAHMLDESSNAGAADIKTVPTANPGLIPEAKHSMRGPADGQPLTDDRIDQINSELDGMSIDASADGRGDSICQIYIDKSPRTQEPILRVDIHKRGADNDDAYELRINEMRRVIRERYGINVRKVLVDGTFEY